MTTEEKEYIENAIHDILYKHYSQHNHMTYVQDILAEIKEEVEKLFKNITHNSTKQSN